MNYRNFRFVSALGLGLAAFAAHAEEPAPAQAPAYSAKSIFFAEDGDVKAVSTSNLQTAAKNETTAVVIDTAPKKAKAVKVAAKKEKLPSSIGAAYFIRLKKSDGNTEDVLATRVFATGEKFQLGLKVNSPSYVYIFNEDADGRITMLHPRDGRTAAVDAMGTVFLPSQGSFQFEGPAGMEKLMVLMAQEEIFQPTNTLKKIKPDLVTRVAFPAAASDASSKAACAVQAKNEAPSAPSAPSAPLDAPVMMADAGNAAYASKAIVFAQDTDNCLPVAQAPAPAYASKAIVFADDPQPAAGQQVASYVVKPQKKSANATKEPLLLKIQLLHR